MEVLHDQASLHPHVINAHEFLFRYYVDYISTKLQEGPLCATVKGPYMRQILTSDDR